MTHPDIVVEINHHAPERSYTLKSLADRLAALRPSRVIVNCAGPGAYVMQILRDHGLPVEVMKKSPSLRREGNDLVFDLHDWMVASDDGLDGVVLMVRRPKETP